jgi:hypothetical protein
MTWAAVHEFCRPRHGLVRNGIHNPGFRLTAPPWALFSRPRRGLS